MSLWILLTFTCVALPTSSAIREMFKLSDYYKMPPMYVEDEFHKCMDETESESVFCSTITTIKPDNSSEIWRLIANFSSDHLRHFRHDIMYGGFCINSCKRKLDQLGLDGDSLYEEEFPIIHPYYNMVYATSSQTNNSDDIMTNTFRNNYDRIVNKCMNLYLTTNYQLRGYTRITACVKNRSDKKDGIDVATNSSDTNIRINDNQENSTIDLVFVVLISVIVVLVLLASFYDSDLHKSFSNKKNAGTVTVLKETILEIFSLKRNWTRLISLPQSDRGKELRFLQGFRYNTMFLIIFGHLTYIFTRVPVQNPQFYEQKYYTLSGMLGLNGYILVQTFFMISGFLMGLAFKDIYDNKRFNWSYFGIATFYRYIRLTPVYVIVLLFEMTSYLKPSGHPFWATQKEFFQHNCQTNWWTNLLYVNNMINVSNICMPHTWFLAADFQVFMYGLVFLMLAWRFPKRKVLILGTCLGIAMIIPVIVTYAKGYSGIYMASPEDFKYHLFQDAFRYFYVPAYTNGGNYIMSMIVGLYYDTLKLEKIIRIFRYPALTVTYLIVPLGLIPIFAGFYLYDDSIDVTAWWIGVWVLISKHYYSFIALAVAFVCVNNLDKLMVGYFNTPIWQPLGRLTYCVYLVHLSVERLVASDRGIMPYITTTTLLTGTTTNLVISSFIALALCLFVEFPTSAFIKLLVKGEKDELERKIELHRSERANQEGTV